MSEDSEGLVLSEWPCPHCGAELTEQRIVESLAGNIWHTSAITSANKFIALDLAIIPFLLVS